MRLKILVVPFSILISLILVIGYIKPDITTLQDKRVMLETKKGQFQGMTTLLSNIDALEASLERQSESENLVQAYLPKTMDQDRIIDMFNYLAAQAGVFVSTMNMKEIALKSEAEEPILAPADAPLVTGVEGTPAPFIPPVSFKPKVQSYVAQVEVQGSYDGIKDFFNRVSHMNRYHKILSFTFETPISDSDEPATGVLSGSLESQFDYFPAQPLDSAMNIPVFLKDEFDAEEFSSLLAWVSYTVPPLMKSDAGRSNPFQP